MATSSVRQHAVSVANVVGQWAKTTGGVPSVDVSESWNGGAKVADLTMGRKKFSNLTLERPFDPIRDRPVIRFLEANLGGLWTTTVTDQDLDANEQSVGAPIVYSGCVPISVTSPEYDTEKSDGSAVVVEFRVQSKT